MNFVDNAGPPLGRLQLMPLLLLCLAVREATNPLWSGTFVAWRAQKWINMNGVLFSLDVMIQNRSPIVPTFEEQPFSTTPQDHLKVSLFLKSPICWLFSCTSWAVWRASSNFCWPKRSITVTSNAIYWLEVCCWRRALTKPPLGCIWRAQSKPACPVWAMDTLSISSCWFSSSCGRAAHLSWQSEFLVITCIGMADFLTMVCCK